MLKLSLSVCILQFEDFANHNAFDLLAKYGPTHLVFNDDIQVQQVVYCSTKCWAFSHHGLGSLPRIDINISHIFQGTASVVLAGLIAALKLVGGTLAGHTFLFLGAGEVVLVSCLQKKKKKKEKMHSVYTIN